MADLTRFSKKYDIPRIQLIKMEKYINFKRHQEAKESDIGALTTIKTLPSNLQIEALKNAVPIWSNRIMFFRGKSEKFILDCMWYMNPKIVLENDYLWYAYDPIQYVGIITNGKLAYCDNRLKI